MTLTGGRATAASAATLLLLCVLVGLGGPAHAAAYRYWSFWDRGADGFGWVYATQGPSTARPSDGDVQGFRFAVSADSDDAAEPRGAARFDAICSGTAARDGQKRIALVLDFGTAEDAPAGETPPPARTACARVPSDATTADALAAVAKPLRYDTNALLCSIAGYPRKGCGEAIADDGPDPSSTSGASSASGASGTSGASDGSAASEDARTSDEKGPSVGLFVGIGAVAVLGAAAVWQARRRRRG
ncbi:SCO2322 family protein [Streptomyces neyagawaensis]|uniref:SCO2322 family protein n=1 Tax=Streptomyces neyagawaensis TaxID=42238 RepID=UPI0006E2C7E6|nr:SCO2322 family protein [Streptomyces neyagawaensis]MCL6732723.1 SCO2322 family protein [Streptomyces neyagawaensis]MDE1681507.1 SCO2322 family protein [Streptomyces neyagawaensis]